MRAINNRGIDDIATARLRTLDYCGKDAVDEEHGTAAEITDHVERRNGRLTVFANRVQYAGHADIVDVMARHLAPRAGLSPASHTAIDQARVNGMTDIRANTHTLGHAGPQAFDKDVGSCDNL